MGRFPRRVTVWLCVPLLALVLSSPGAAQVQANRQQAEALDASARFPQAAQAWQALLGADSARPLDHDRALALLRLVISLRAAGEDGRADALIPRIRTIDAKAVQPGDVTLPNAFLVLGLIENLRQRQELVDALYTQGYALAVAGLGKDHEVSRGFTWNALAMQLMAEQEGGQVLPESERRQQIQELARQGPRPVP